MTLPVRPSRLRRAAFTLIELICVIAIIAVLASLIMPSIGTVQQKALSISCASNLRAIGVACQAYLSDHNNLYPCVQPLPTVSAYPADFQETVYPSLAALDGSAGALTNYGITTDTIKCPADMKSPNCSYTLYKSSYDWRPTLDDEVSTEPIIYGRRFVVTGSTGAFVAKLSKVRQVYDDNVGIHFGHVNALYADGHVVSYTGPTVAHH